MENQLWMATAARCYQEAFPVGNGRMGAMMYGDMVRERVLLNESSMWSGSPQDNNRKDAYSYLEEIRALLFAGENEKAQRIFEEHFNCEGPGSGFAAAASLPFGCYQTLGNLDLFFHQKISVLHGKGQSMSGGGQCEDATDYRRVLTLDSAIAEMSYTVYGTHFKRECLASKAYETVLYRISADQSGSINFNAQLNRSENFMVEAVGGDGLLMTGQLDNGVDGKGVRYACYLRVKIMGGEVYTEHTTLHVRHTDEAILYVTAATDMQSFGARNLTDAVQAVKQDMEYAYAQSWDTIQNEHRQFFGSFYGRTKFDLYSHQSEQPLDKRLVLYRQNQNDQGLCELLFHYARYLLISSTREDGLPANLQGIWADEVQTPWNGDWHLDAQQMNFWSAENCNLSELHMPYLRLAASMVESGKTTAQAYYHAKGWVAHVITNPWGYTAPGEEAYWGATTTGSAWVCTHLWEHYRYTEDQNYLKWAYPILKGCAEFYNDFLVRDPQTGHWVTAPGNSPENSFVMESGAVVQLCVAPTYDSQLVRYLLKACIEACGILGVDEDFAEELQEKVSNLAPTKIASDGRVMEWAQEYKEALPYHRHLSHLWGLYPGDEITPTHTSKLAEAAGKSIAVRGKSSAGWANAMRMGMLARLQKGEEAFALLDFQLQNNCFPNLFGRTYHAPETVRTPTMPQPEKYDYPFQIDCNLAMAGLITEFLMQSHLTRANSKKRIVHLLLLPALPSAWKAGVIEGIRARGGFELRIQWAKGRLEQVTITSLFGEELDVSYGNITKSYRLEKGQTIILDQMLCPITESGKSK